MTADTTATSSDHSWKGVLIEKATPWVLRNNLLCDKGHDTNPSTDAYHEARGTKQRSRSKDPMESGFWDMHSYQPIIDDALSSTPKNTIIADLGCGSGRFVDILLQKGFTRIIAQDHNADDLNSLLKNTPTELLPCVLPVCGSLSDLPPWEGIADSALMIEVAYALADPDKAYHCANLYLRRGGIAIVSNIAAPAYICHSLLNGAFEQVDSILKNNTYTDHIGRFPIDVTVLTPERMRASALRAGFEVLKSHTITGIPALLLHAMRQQGILSEDRLSLVERSAESEINIPRIYVDILRKQ